jgi:glycerol-3-phosphate dehydrogenase
MQLQKDIVIFGGGIAGLWLLHRLRSAGFDAVLFDQQALGSGQTIASQGMIHGGLKYALGGNLTNASEAIAEMPSYWQRCLRGEGPVDLRGTQLLSDAYYLLPSASLRSRLTAFLGSKVVSSKATPVPPAALPAFFQGQLQGPLYQLHDIVLDVPSLLHTLGSQAHAHIHLLPNSAQAVQRDAQGNITALHLPDGRQLHAKLFICSAGNGNADFLPQQPQSQIAMQQRPLQMVIVKHQIKHPVYVHCVGDDFSATPELTLTTHQCSDGNTAWYLGGELAESGVGLPALAQQQRARALLQRLFPWCDLATATFHSVPIDRAEAQQPHNKRPDRDSVLIAGNVLYCWPTKLTLAPALADNVLNTVQRLQVQPCAMPSAAFSNLPYPGIATAPWNLL